VCYLSSHLTKNFENIYKNISTPPKDKKQKIETKHIKTTMNENTAIMTSGDNRMGE